MSMTLEDAWYRAQIIDGEIFGPEKSMEGFADVLRDEVEELLTKSDDLNEVEEFGDVLFCLASYARVRAIDPVAALQTTLIKLRDRVKREKSNEHQEFEK